MSPGRKDGINTCITNVVLELLYICVYWYMPNITYFNLFTCRLLQRVLGCIIRRGCVRRASACPAPRPALREAVLWWRAECWWCLLSMALSCCERRAHWASDVPFLHPMKQGQEKIQQGLPFLCHLSVNRRILSKSLNYFCSQHTCRKKRKDSGVGAEQLQAISLKVNVLTLPCL